MRDGLEVEKESMVDTDDVTLAGLVDGDEVDIFAKFDDDVEADKVIEGEIEVGVEVEVEVVA